MCNTLFMGGQRRLTHLRPRWNRLRRRYDAVYVRASDKRWARSEFPHPRVTLDFDADGGLIGVEVIGTELRTEST